ncbi:hypothetical protein SteCoe_15511 [Stentor coeruleus]|uniref:Uncharacterized protein n=1 Tax=Stentor coeruleus TaxID=5963 RepID=A0A1R2C3E6_9CILI|nr:hypothetical protein SteCoe_15511 [Stentor coeruleus]
MSEFANRNNVLEKETLESQIDRLNMRINEFMNNSLMSCDDSERISPIKKSNCDDTEISMTERFSMNEKYFINEDNEELYYLCNRSMMKFEDMRSDVLRNNEGNDLDFSEIRSSFGDFYRHSDAECRDITMKDLYELYKQVKGIIDIVESGGSYLGNLKFVGINYALAIYGMEISQKETCSSQFVSESINYEKKNHELQTQVVELKKKLSIPNEAIDRFCENIEREIVNSYNDTILLSPINNQKYLHIGFKDLIDSKSWSLLEQNYRKLKISHKKCEEISNNLAWQNAEIQVIKMQTQKKLKQSIEKEIELKFRQEVILKLQEEHERNIIEIKSKRETMEKEILRIDKYKRKLEKMRAMIKTQLQKLSTPKSQPEAKRPNSTSRINKTSPTLKRIRKMTSTKSTDHILSEINDIQKEISTLESFSEKSSNESDSVRLSHLYTKLSDLKTQKALGQFTASSTSMQIKNMNFSKSKPQKALGQFTASSTSMQIKNMNFSKSKNQISVTKKINSSSAQNSPTNTPIKSLILSSSENSADLSKPPIYKKTLRTNTEVIENLTQNTKDLYLREERVAEKEAELERKEKELQYLWVNSPNNERLTRIVSEESDKLTRLQIEYDRKLKILQDQISKYDSMIEKAKEDQNIVYINTDGNIDKLKELYRVIEELLI